MNESDGEWKAFLSAPADMGARFEAALRADHDAVFRDAHAAGRREPDAAYRLDALLNVMERGAAGRPNSRPNSRPDRGTAPTAAAKPSDAGDDGGSERSGPSPARRSGRQQTVIVTVDLAALTRGRVGAGETCRIEGVGEVSLAAVRALIPAAHVSYVIRDGVDVRSVVHLGRQATAHQRTALHARGYECEVPHCRASHLLEIDHVRDWAFSRHTRLDELAWFCAAHHSDKTAGTRRLTGPPGRRRWDTATGIQISRDPPDGTATPDRPDPDGPVERGSPPGQPSTRPAPQQMAAL